MCLFQIIKWLPVFSLILHSIFFSQLRAAQSSATKNLRKILLAPVGVLAPGSAHAYPLLSPPSTPAECFAARACKLTFKKSPPTQNFRTKGQLLKGMGGLQISIVEGNPNIFVN